jgi:arabinofuranosyltransferase
MRSLQPNWSRVWLAFAFLLFAWLLHRTAWVSDDAFISLRTVRNLLDGYGLRWNVSERVQTFTHPLWLFALTGAHAITGEPFYSTLYLSWIVSCAAVGLLLFVCPGNVFDKTVALFALAFSQAFVDFSSSGLENPFTHLAVVAFATVYVRVADLKRRALWLSVIAGLAMLNRLDTSVLFIPTMAHALWRTRREVALRYYLVGALPLVGWETFSLLYYGFPFPNTAYAKLAQDQISNAKLTPFVKGARYLLSSLQHDPLTLTVIAGVLGLATFRRFRHVLWLAAGAAAYLLYVVRIGGDFMGGRFLSAPLFLCSACWVISGAAQTRVTRVAILPAVVALALLGQFPPPLTDADFGLGPGESDLDAFGIHNERRLFFRSSSLHNADVMNPMRPDHPWSANGFQLNEQAKRGQRLQVEVVDAIGYAGYFAGPRVHIVDHWALADALIARLPPVFGQYGHYPRALPDGYLATLATHMNLLADTHLRKYYGELSNVIRGPIFEASRLRSAWKLNTGQLAGELDQYAFIRGKHMVMNLRVGNPRGFACVTTYVWNAERATTYVLDDASHRGSTYELTWHVSPHGATLVRPANARKLKELSELAERGMFTASIAFSELSGGPIRDLHELRFTYHRTGDGFVVQRQPWPIWIQDFPSGRWIEGRAPGVLLDHYASGM